LDGTHVFTFVLADVASSFQRHICGCTYRF
jgi:hypothetical protein